MAWRIHLMLGLGLFLLVNCVSSACVEKYLDGKTAKNTWKILVGEKAKLQCDVSAKGVKDMVYWKNDNNVMSQDNLVVPKFENKFNVTLKDDIYTLEWIAEADDVGVYNCTCATGGIQFPVWIKRPCNKKQHVLKMTDLTSGSALTFGQDKKLKCNETLRFYASLDCDCTWPEVKRTFEGKWCRKEAGSCQTDTAKLPGPLRTGVPGHQNGTTPIGCYTGHGLVTYRYKDVYGSFKEVGFECTPEVHGSYCFYMDEGETKLPGVNERFICIDCDCLPPTTPPPTKPPTPRPPAPIKECENQILMIVLIVCGVVCLVCILIIVIMAVKGGRGSGGPRECLYKVVIAITAIVFICVIVVVCLKISDKLPKECKELTTGFIVGTAVVLLAAVILMIAAAVLLCRRPPEDDPVKSTHVHVQGHVNTGYDSSLGRDPRYNPEVNTLPLSEQQPQETNSQVFVKQNNMFNSIDRQLDPSAPQYHPSDTDSHGIDPHEAQLERKSKLADPKIRSDYEDVPPPRKELPDETLCCLCRMNIVNGYFLPCQHSEICQRCDENMNTRYACPLCQREVLDYRLFSRQSPVIWHGRGVDRL